MRVSVLLILSLVGVGMAMGASAQFNFIPIPGVSPAGITTGSDGNVWFTAGSRLGRVTFDGSITWFDLPGVADTSSIVTGPDGNLWVLRNGAVEVFSISSGLIAEYPFVGGFEAVPSAFIVGPDGALWIGDGSRQSIWRLSTAGEFTEFSVAPVRPRTLCSGPDGNLWFGGGAFGNGIRRMTTLGQVTGAFAVPRQSVTNTAVLSCGPGPDGNVWFATSRTVGRVTPTGSVTQYPVANPRFYSAIILGADGNLWVAGDQSLSCVILACPPPPEQDGILRVSLSGSQVFYPFPLGQVISDIARITVGAHGALWLTGVNGIVRFDAPASQEQFENIPTSGVAGRLVMTALVALAGFALLRR